MNKAFYKSYEAALMSLLRSIANLCCEDLGIKYKSFKKIHYNDKYFNNDLCGYNKDGHIRIFLHDKDYKYFSLNELIDTVVHEIVHILYYRHDHRHKRMHNKLLKKVKNYLKIKSK